MMKTKLLLIVVIFVLFGNASSYQSAKKPRTVDDYIPRTLKELGLSQSGSRRDMESEARFVVQGDILPSRVRVTYRVSARSLPQEKKDLIAVWAQRFAGMPEFYTVPYEREVLFAEEGDEHWLAVKKSLLPGLAQEVRKGQAVDLYLIQLGRIRTGDKWVPVRLVEAFAKPPTVSTSRQ
jgi:hypothetical protein